MPSPLPNDFPSLSLCQYLCEPLRKCLKDTDPYVRKTAAVCVAKLYDIDPQLVHEQGFIDALTDLLSDATPMVVANAVAALSEIHEYSKSKPPGLVVASLSPWTDSVFHPSWLLPAGSVFELTPGTVSKLLTALNECTEWGQVFILDSLALYEPQDDRERQSICERVTPRLQHVNAAVVLSAVKVRGRLFARGWGVYLGPEINSFSTSPCPATVLTLFQLSLHLSQVLMKNIDRLQDADTKTSFYKKLAPPLVTLLSSEPEVQYVALRNINLVVQKHPKILANHMKVGGAASLLLLLARSLFNFSSTY